MHNPDSPYMAYGDPKRVDTCQKVGHDWTAWQTYTCEVFGSTHTFIARQCWHCSMARSRGLKERG